jgi:hypothetical protein
MNAEQAAAVELRRALLLGRPSVRDLAEDETAPLADCLRAYLAYLPGGIGSIADVLLKRAATELGISEVYADDRRLH